MNEIRKLEFEGKPLTLTQRDGEWCANGDEVAAVLGYEDKRQLSNLFKRHEREFLPSETFVVNLRTNPGDAPRKRMGSPVVRLFSLRGLEHLAILGRTETCVRFRRWVLDVIHALRTEGMITLADAQRIADEQIDARLPALISTVTARTRLALAEDIRATGRLLDARVHRQSVALLRAFRQREAIVRRMRDQVDEAIAGAVEKFTGAAAQVIEKIERAAERLPAPVAAAPTTSAPTRYVPRLLGPLLAEIARAFPSPEGFTVAQVTTGEGQLDAALMSALAAVLLDPAWVDRPQKVGHTFRRLRDVESGGRVLRHVGFAHGNVTRWRVDPVALVAPMGRPTPSVRSES